MKNKIYNFHEKNKNLYPVFFFIGGVVFDLLTLGSVDDSWTLLSLSVFTLLAAVILSLEFLELSHLKELSSDSFFGLWKYKDEAFHFLLGSVLSAFFFFYFQSASIQASFSFLFFWIFLLLFNEFFPLGEKGLFVKFLLVFFCVHALMILIFPIVIGHVEAIVYCVSVLIAFTLLFLWGSLFKKALFQKFGPAGHSNILRKNFRFPLVFVSLFFLIVYFSKVIPPIPLSLSYSGVFHKIEKSQGDYKLSYSRPFWKFWQRGAQDFSYQSGDKVYVFVKVYSPSNFKDKVYVRWQKYNNQQWTDSDRIEMSVSGGRKKGYRAYAYKQNYSEGRWRVLVESKDSRELGRIYFNLSQDMSNNERVFSEVIH